MREIKFRRVFFFDEERTKFSHSSEWGVNIGNAVFASPSNNNFTLSFTDSQFTGLKDKNGKEIYEGDWCEAKFRDAEDIHVIEGEIIEDEFMWCLDNSHENNIYSINRLYDFIILGNIYENPELFKTPTHG